MTKGSFPKFIKCRRLIVRSSDSAIFNNHFAQLSPQVDALKILFFSNFTKINVLKIAETEDRTINLRHLMKFEVEPFDIRILNTNEIVHTMEELVSIAGEFV